MNVIDANDRTGGCETLSLSSPPDISAARVSIASTARDSIDSSWSIGGFRRNCVQQLGLQFDVRELRSRFAKSESSNDDLRKQLKKKDQELRIMEERLRSMNQNMQAIHKIEDENTEEVTELKRRCNDLQRDTNRLSQQLAEKESQYQELFNHCRSQEVAWAKSSDLRAENKALFQHIEQLKHSQQVAEKTSASFKVHQEIERYKQQNQEQKIRLNKLERDKAAIADTLANTLKNDDELKLKNMDLEQQIHRNEKRAALQLEQERRSYSEEVRALKDDMFRKQQSLEELEVIICQQRMKMDKLVHEQEKRANAFEAENAKQIEMVNAANKETIDRLQSKIEERNVVISSLREELGRYMQQVMTLTAKLDQAESQNHDFQELRRSSSIAQNDADLTRRQLEQGLDESVATIKSLEVRISKQQEDISHLQQVIDSGKAQDATIRSLQFDLAKAREDLHNVAQIKQDVSDANETLKANLAVLDRRLNETAASDETLKVQEERVYQLEQDLKEQIALKETIANARDALNEIVISQSAGIKQLNTRLSALEVENCSITQDHHVALEKHQLELEAQETEHRNIICNLQNQSESSRQQLQKMLDESNAAISSLETQLRKQQDAISQLKETDSSNCLKMQSLESELAKSIEALSECTVETNGLKQESSALRDEVAALRQRYEEDFNNHVEASQKYEENIKHLEMKLCDQSKTRINERDKMEATVASRNSMITDMISRLASLELEKDTTCQQLAVRNNELVERTNRIADLEGQVESISQKLSTSDHAATAMSSRITILEMEVVSLTKALAEKDETIDEITDHAQVLANEKELLVHKLQQEIDRHKRSLDSRNNLAEAAETGLRETLSALKKELDTSCRDLRKSLDLSEAKVTDQRKTIQSLQADISRITTNLESEQQSKAQAEESCSVLRQKINEIQQHCDNEVNIYHDNLAVAETRIQTLQKELAILNRSSASTEQTLRSEVDNLTAELKKLQTTIAGKNDEIHGLRTVNLKESENRVASLSLKLGAVEEELKQSKSQASITIASLKSELDDCKVLLRDREKSFEQLSTENNQKAHRFLCTVTMMNEQLAAREAELQEQEAKLQAFKVENSSLTRKNSLYCQREDALQYERDQLLASEKDWMQAKARLEKEVENLGSQVVMLETRLSDMEQKSTLAFQQLSEAELKLTQKVEDIENLEFDLGMEQANSQATQETLTRVQLDLALKEEEIQRLEDENRRKKEEFNQTIHLERLERESAESDLRVANSRLLKAQQDKKLISDLQKENAQWKDRVERQTNYIQRLQEKVKADRNRKGSVDKNIDSMKPPARVGSALKRDVASSVRIPLGANRSIASDMSSVSHDDLWDMESLCSRERL